MLPRVNNIITSKALMLACVFFLNACVLSPTQKEPSKTSNLAVTSKELNQYQLLLASLLDEIDVEHYSYTTQQGVKKFDQLKHFKALEQLYISSIENKSKHNSLTTEQIKTVLFFSFYAEQKNSAAFLEYLAADLMGVYNSQATEFLKLLNGLPFLVASNCGRLNAYFGFEGKKLSGKPSFLSTNRDLIQKFLSSKNAKVCLNEFE